MKITNSENRTAKKEPCINSLDICFSTPLEYKILKLFSESKVGSSTNPKFANAVTANEIKRGSFLESFLSSIRSKMYANRK